MSTAVKKKVIEASDLMREDVWSIKKVSSYSDEMARLYFKQFAVAVISPDEGHKVTITALWGSRSKYGRRCTARIKIDLNPFSLSADITRRIRSMGYGTMQAAYESSFVMYNVHQGLVAAHCIDNFRDLLAMVFGIRFCTNADAEDAGYESYISWLSSHWERLFTDAGCKVIHCN